MKLEKLQYFIDLVETGSFTKAGQMNFVSQTSISQNISSLEKYFSCQLVDRSKYPIVATEAGKILYSECLKIIADYSHLENTLYNYVNDISTITIAYSSIIGSTFLNKFISFFESKQTINIDVQKININQASEKIKQHQVDFYIGLDSEFISEPKIDFLTIIEDSYVAVAGKQSTLFTTKSISTKELYSNHIIMLSENIIGKSFDLMISHSKDDGFDPLITKKVNDVETEILELERTNVVGLFPKNDPLVSTNTNLNVIAINNSSHKYKIGLAYLHNSANTSKIMQFKKMYKL